METGKLMDMVEVFEGLEDWRNAQQTRHRLSEMLTIAVCAVLSGADDFEDISHVGAHQTAVAASLPEPGLRHRLARHPRFQVIRLGFHSCRPQINRQLQ